VRIRVRDGVRVRPAAEEDLKKKEKAYVNGATEAPYARVKAITGQTG